MTYSHGQTASHSQRSLNAVNLWQKLCTVFVSRALLSTRYSPQVFDDWKDYCSHQIVHHRFDDDAFKFVPHLSNATLAYLEASCR